MSEANWSAETATGKLEGFVAPGFTRVAEVFEQNFRLHSELGASVAVTIDGETVVDVWGGYADINGLYPWERNTKSLVWSCTKGATAFCAHILASRGELNLDALVSDYWPEYAQNGKHNTTVSMLLSHQSGICVLTNPIPDGGFYDWDLMISLIEKQQPQFEPGTTHGYQGMTFGWLIGEVIRRISGKSLGTFFHDNIAKPIGADFWIGMPEDQESNCASLIQPDPAGADLSHPFFQAGMQEDTVQWHLLNNSGRHMSANENGAACFDTQEAHRAEIGAAGGITNGRGLAQMYSALAVGGTLNGRTYVDADTLARMGAVASASGRDFALKRPSRFSLGFMKSDDNRPALHAEGESVILSEPAFGHAGYGGSMGFADPEAAMSFGYTMNRMGQGTGLNIRGQSLVDAVYESLGYNSNRSGRWIKN